MKIILVLSMVFSCSLCFAQQAVDNATPEENYKRAYLTFSKKGNYEEKEKMLKVFRDNYTNDSVIDMMVDLLDHFYDNDQFAENDQVMYYDDVIAENLEILLEKSGSKKGFPALLKIALNSSKHREQTVKEAWHAIGAIKW